MALQQAMGQQTAGAREHQKTGEGGGHGIQRMTQQQGQALDEDDLDEHEPETQTAHGHEGWPKPGRVDPPRRTAHDPQGQQNQQQARQDGLGERTDHHQVACLQQRHAAAVSRAPNFR